MKNVIVTGASGFIGTTLVNELLKRAYQIVAIDRRFTDDFLNNPNITCIDATDNSVCDLKKEIPVQEYDCFFHLAWAATSGPGRADYKVQLDNVKMACDYVKLCDSSTNIFKNYELNVRVKCYLTNLWANALYDDFYLFSRKWRGILANQHQSNQSIVTLILFDCWWWKRSGRASSISGFSCRGYDKKAGAFHGICWSGIFFLQYYSALV